MSFDNTETQHPRQIEAQSHNPAITPELIAQLLHIARAAGDAIMAIYSQRDSYNTQHKTDDSPLTAADLAAHKLIAQALPALLTIPILSEEGTLPSYRERQTWNQYWLVDPLDGTKEFIAGNGEFTVNIALIIHGQPRLGVVHVPATNTTYIGVLEAQDPADLGAWRYSQAAPRETIKVRSLRERQAQGLPLTTLLSHRHGTHASNDLMTLLATRWPGPIETINAGSSLKFCAIAEGRADFYPRLAPTCEWDTGAAQAVLEAAGGQVVELITHGANQLKPLRYNTQDELLNPFFYGLGDQDFDWLGLLSDELNVE